MNMKSGFIWAVCMVSPVALAAPSINDMQTCQALLDFVDTKLDAAPSHYPADDVMKVRKGLDQYNAFIQSSVVTPGLLQYNGGDKAKADAMQLQVDAYKQSVVQGLSARYPQQRLFTDQAVAVNNCAQKLVPQGQALEDLKVAVNMIVTLAQTE